MKVYEKHTLREEVGGEGVFLIKGVKTHTKGRGRGVLA